MCVPPLFSIVVHHYHCGCVSLWQCGSSVCGSNDGVGGQCGSV